MPRILAAGGSEWNFSHGLVYPVYLTTSDLLMKDAVPFTNWEAPTARVSTKLESAITRVSEAHGSMLVAVKDETDGGYTKMEYYFICSENVENYFLCHHDFFLPFQTNSLSGFVLIGVGNLRRIKICIIIR